MGCRGCGKPIRSHREQPKVGVVRTSGFKKRKITDLDRLGVFGLGAIKDFLVFEEFLESSDITIDDVRKWISEEEGEVERENKEAAREMREYMKFFRMGMKCPDCDSELGMVAVNNHPRMMVGHGYKFLIFCQDDMKCGWEHYTKKTIGDWVNDQRKARAQAIREVKKIKRGLLIHKEDSKPIIKEN